MFTTTTTKDSSLLLEKHSSEQGQTFSKMPSLSQPEGRKGEHHPTNHQTKGNGDANAAHCNEPMPIAIVGISCRFPGDATDPEQLWNMISKGRSAWSEVPPDRWNVDAFHHPSGDRQGTVSLFPVISRVGSSPQLTIFNTFLR